MEHKDIYRFFGGFLLILLSFTSLWGNPLTYAYHLQELAAEKQAQCLFQDTDGFIWVGARGSLLRYDGSQFATKDLPDSVSHTLVNTIIQIQADSLWISLSSGSLFSYRPSLNRWTWLTLFPDKLRTLYSITPTLTIAGVKNQGLWIQDGDQAWEKYEGPFATQLNDVYQLAAGPDQQIVCGTDYGLFLLDFSLRGTPGLKVRQLLSHQIVTSVAHDGKTGWWIGTYNQGLFHVSYQGQLTPNRAKWFWGEIKSIAVVGQDIWIGTHRRGVVIQKGQGYFPQAQPFANDNIAQLIFGIDGTLWLLSTQNGLAYTIPAFGFLELPKQKILTSLIDSNMLWYSTIQGLFRYEFDSLRSVTVPFPSPAPPICLFRDSWDYLWVGTQGDGLWRYHIPSRNWEHYHEKEGLINNHVLSIAGNGPHIWLATFGGAEQISLNQIGEIIAARKFGAEQGLGINYLYQVLPDSKQKTWFATDGKGLRVLKEKKIDILPGTEKKTVLQMTQSPDGKLFFAVSSEGLNAWDGQALSHFDTEQGLRNNRISTLKSDQLNRILCLHKAGLDLFLPTIQQFLPFEFPTAWGQWASSLQIISENTDHCLWITTETGVLVYQPALIPLAMSPDISVQGISLFQKPFETRKNETPTFTHTQNHISFPVSMRWFANPSSLSYAYILQPIDLDWTSSKDKAIIYPNLSPGTYELIVKPCFDTHCLDQKLIRKSFIVSKPIWEKVWFWGLCTLAAVGIFFFILKKRESNLKNREQLKQAYTKVQFELLKSQVNPHFLFNSFNTLAAIIENDPPAGVVYLDHLSDLFRSILTNKDQNVISLSEELEILENFYRLQRYRYRDNFQLHICLPEAKDTIAIPPLTLQMLVENALKHNIISAEKPFWIKIDLDPNGYISISNPLQKRIHETHSTGMGLINIRERYQALTAKEVKVEITQKEFVVYLPLINIEKHESLSD